MFSLFVHGGCHGAWCWDSVVASVVSRGQMAHAFDLPGAGADPTPRAGLTLADSVAAVVSQLDAAPPGPLRLVAHSIGALPVAEAVVARPGRVNRIVLVAAVVPVVGERAIDTIPTQRRGGYYELAESSSDNTVMPDFASTRARFFNELPDDRARAAYDRLTPQPFDVYLQPTQVCLGALGVPIRYLAPADDRNFDADVTARYAAAAGADVEVIAGDHCAMLSQPHALVEALLAGA